MQDSCNQGLKTVGATLLNHVLLKLQGTFNKHMGQQAS